MTMINITGDMMGLRKLLLSKYLFLSEIFEEQVLCGFLKSKTI